MKSKILGLGLAVATSVSIGLHSTDSFVEGSSINLGKELVPIEQLSLGADIAAHYVESGSTQDDFENVVTITRHMTVLGGAAAGFAFGGPAGAFVGGFFGL